MKYLVMAIRRPSFDPSVRTDHYAFLKSLRERGILEQSGPFTDQSGGAYVIRAVDLEDACAIAHQDPLHRRGCSELTVREWDSE